MSDSYGNVYIVCYKMCSFAILIICTFCVFSGVRSFGDVSLVIWSNEYVIGRFKKITNAVASRSRPTVRRTSRQTAGAGAAASCRQNISTYAPITCTTREYSAVILLRSVSCVFTINTIQSCILA